MYDVAMKDKNPQLELKKQELLYATTKDEMTQIYERFDKIEEKAGRHFTILTGVLGIAALGLNDVVAIVLGPCSFSRDIFLLSYLSLVVFTVTAMIFHLMTLKFSALSQIIIGNQYVSQVEAMNYVTTLYKASMRNIEYIEKNMKTLEVKIRYAQKAYFFTFFVLGAGIISGMLYLLYSIDPLNYVY
jgi:hypothetical protein